MLFRWNAIGTEHFRNNKTIRLFNELSLFTSVTGLLMRFQGCNKLEEVSLAPRMLLQNLAFDGCSKLNAIMIPSAITTIGEYCFRGCSSLKTITSQPTTPPTLSIGAFQGVSPDVVYVPSASVAAYKSASGWSAWASKIVAIEV